MSEQNKEAERVNRYWMDRVNKWYWMLRQNRPWIEVVQSMERAKGPMKEKRAVV